jgi:hypothetical protein
MSIRERWIVYPLLLLALGVALRDKFIPPTRFSAAEIRTSQLWADQILCGGPCKAANIATAQLQADQVFSGVSNCGALVIKGPNDQTVAIVALDPISNTAMIETFSASTGMPFARLQSTDKGKLVLLFSQTGKGLMIEETGNILPINTSKPEKQHKADKQQKIEKPAEKKKM